MRFRDIIGRRSESGRGMVEILGVLAIMGVLSIVSVYAYKRAMDKTLTNEVINTLAQRAVVASAQKEQGAKVNLEEFDEDTFTKQYNMTYQDEGDEFFSITMENVPDEVIKGIASMKWKIPYNVYVNGVQIYDYDFSKKAPKSLKSSFASFLIKQAYAAESGNQLKLVFHKKLEAYEKQPYIGPETCTETGGTWDGSRCNCHGKDMTESGCKACRPYLKDGVSKCGQGDNKDDDDEDVMCYRDSECRGCLDVCRNGKCVLNREDECDGNHLRCEGDQIVACIRTGSKDTNCATHQEVVQNCAQGSKGTCSMESGHAECVDTAEDCEEGEFRNDAAGGTCSSCDDIRFEGASVITADADTTDCESCSNVEVMVHNGKKVCAPKCKTGFKRFPAGGEEMSLTCYEASCPAGYYRDAKNTECTSCDKFNGEAMEYVMTFLGNSCADCPNVDVIDGICYSKPKTCKQGEFKDENGNCVSCEAARTRRTPYSATKTGCATCSGISVEHTCLSADVCGDYCLPNEVSCMAQDCSCANYATKHPCECDEDYARNHQEECGSTCSEGTIACSGCFGNYDENGHCGTPVTLCCDKYTETCEYSGPHGVNPRCVYNGVSCMAQDCSCANYATKHPCECDEDYARNHQEECGSTCSEGTIACSGCFGNYDENGHCGTPVTLCCDKYTETCEYSGPHGVNPRCRDVTIGH